MGGGGGWGGGGGGGGTILEETPGEPAMGVEDTSRDRSADLALCLYACKAQRRDKSIEETCLRKTSFSLTTFATTSSELCS